MSAQMLDVLSVLDKNEEPILGNCTLQMGDFALEFKNGRSKVLAQHAPEVLRHPKITIPGYTGAVAPLPPNKAADLPPIGDVRQQGRQDAGEREARLREAEAHLRAEGLPVPNGGLPPAEEITALRARLAELEQSSFFAADAAPTGTLIVGDGVEKAGIEVPLGETGTLVVPPEGVVPGETPGWPVDAATGIPLDLTPAEREALAEAALGSKTIPEGFDAETADGKPRCWARKGDGFQCSNAAVDGTHACGLSAHQK
jgi:hypothetical protein